MHASTLRARCARAARSTFTLLALLGTLAPIGVGITRAGAGSADSGEYVCPPCGSDCHARTWNAPGNCDVCSMPLVPRALVRKVAIVLWDGVELLDFSGPGEVFAAARGPGGESFEVYTVASTSEPITSQGFVRVVPSYSLADAPIPDIVVLPGGGTRAALSDEKLLAWITAVAPETDTLMSVCTGAFVLARTGLLDGLEATTWHGALDDFEKSAPKTRVLRDRRFVDNGKIVTCAGVSAGIDGALHVVSRMLGNETAVATARYMEYDWRPERFAVERGESAPAAKPASTESPREAEAAWERALAFGAEGDLELALAHLEQSIKAGYARPSRAMIAPELAALRSSASHRARLSALWAVNARESEIAIAAPDEPGTRLLVSGRVIDDEHGEPIAGARVYLFHTDDRGLYADDGGNTNARLFGYLVSDPEGRFEVRTIVPASYPETQVTRHVHYVIEAPGFRASTSEFVFTDDPLLTPGRREQALRDGWPVVEPTPDANGGKRCELVLELARE